MAEDASNILDLPTDLLSRIACLTACPATMARASQACRLLREPCGDGATDRGFALGYEEFADDEDGNRLGQEAMPAYKSIFHLLFLLHVDPETARLPPGIDVPSGSAALHMLRTDFARFEPILCSQLKLPEEIDEDDARPHLTEYANAAALLSLAGVTDDVSIPAIQAIIEGAWAEGMDRAGAAHFQEKLVGKSGLDACIGAADLLVAVWHKRCNAFLIEMVGPRSGTIAGRLIAGIDHGRTMAALRQMVALLYGGGSCDDLSHPGPQWVQLPMFLQMHGGSCLIVGVTTGIEEALLVADPLSGGIQMIRDDDLPQGEFQLLVITGSGPSPEATLSTILEAAGQTGGAAEIAPVASFRLAQGGWSIAQDFPGRGRLVPSPDFSTPGPAPG